MNKEFIQALKTGRRNGDDMVLIADHRPDESTRLVLRTTVRMPDCTPDRVERENAVDCTATVSNYSKILPPERYVCSAQGYKYSDEGPMIGLVNILRADDMINLKWVICNSIDSMREAGFGHDQCFIQIFRNTKLYCTLLMADEHYRINSSWPGMSHYSYRKEG